MVQKDSKTIMFTTQIDTYCSLLQQAIGLSAHSLNAPRSTLNAANIDVLVHLAQIQGTAPLIFDKVLSIHDSQCTMHDELQMQMKQVCMQNMMGYEHLLSLLKKTWNGLVAGGVQPVVLKGFGLASLYPIPYLRSWGDLDIYVGPNQYHQSAAILRDTFPEAKHHDEEWEELKHYNFVLPDGNVIEMHRTSAILMHPIKNKYFLKLESDAMTPENVQWVEMEDVRFAIPEAKFNLLFTFLHAWEHFVENGVGMKQLCDLALLAHHTHNQQSSIAGTAINNQLAISNSQLLPSYLRRHLRRLHLYEPWQLIGYVCVTALGLPKSEWPLYEEGGRRLQARRERFMQHVMTNGLIPRHSVMDPISRQKEREMIKRMNIFARKWKTLTSRIADVRAIVPYSPKYARYMAIGIILKGIYRTITGAKMID